MKRPDVSKRNFKHGMARTPSWRSWVGMFDRCYNKKNHAYKNYGGRGISVCRRWHKFINFYADMGDRPPGASIERIDNDGNYNPSNCKWATRAEQRRNSRQNVLIRFGGITMCMADWAKESGISRAVLHARIKSGWPKSRWLMPTKRSGLGASIQRLSK